MSSVNMLREGQQSSSSSTRVKKVKLSHTWVIEDVLNYFDWAGFVTENQNENQNLCKVLKSAKFKNKHVELYLECYPCGVLTPQFLSNLDNEINDEVPNSSTLGLRASLRGDEMFMTFKLYLVSTTLGKTPINFEIDCPGLIFPYKESLKGNFSTGRPGSITIGGIIRKPSVQELGADKLSIYCEINYTTATTYADNTPVQSNHFEKLVNNFAKMRMNTASTDIILLVRGKEFRAHKFWLCAQSEYFETMLLKHDTKEKQENRVEITDVDSSVFEKLLDFIYSGKGDCVKGCEDQLLVAADKYGLDELKDACADELAKRLTPSTVTDILKLARTYNASKLAQKAKDYLKIHGQDTIDAMFANNQADQLIADLEHLARPGSSSSPGSSNQNYHRSGNNFQGRNNNNRTWRPRGGRGGNQLNQN